MITNEAAELQKEMTRSQKVESHLEALNILLCGSSFPHKLLTLLRPGRRRKIAARVAR
jgi:hypothetical protein